MNGTCQLISDPCSGVSCDGNGTCYEDWDGSAVCDCTEQFYGATATACDLCDQGGGGLVCACPTGYTGTNCDQCDAGYVNVDGTCLLDPCSGVSCEGVGTCYVDPAVAGDAVCDCDGTYFGSTLTQCDQCGAGGGGSSDLFATGNTVVGTVTSATKQTFAVNLGTISGAVMSRSARAWRSVSINSRSRGTSRALSATVVARRTELRRVVRS